METWFGKASLGAADLLPKDFLIRVTRETAAQAVLFLDITQSKPYPPLVFSFRARLVDTTTGETVWAADEIFDSTQATTARGARRYARRNSTGTGDHGHAVLQSPTLFSEYAFNAVTQLLPVRPAPKPETPPSASQAPTKFPVRADK
jgi:hypothetical protein